MSRNFSNYPSSFLFYNLYRKGTWGAEVLKGMVVLSCVLSDFKYRVIFVDCLDWIMCPSSVEGTFSFITLYLLIIIFESWNPLHIVIASIFSFSTTLTTITYYLKFVIVSLSKATGCLSKIAFAISLPNFLNSIWQLFELENFSQSNAWNLVDASTILVITSIDDVANLLNASSLWVSFVVAKNHVIHFPVMYPEQFDYYSKKNWNDFSNQDCMN